MKKLFFALLLFFTFCSHTIQAQYLADYEVITPYSSSLINPILYSNYRLTWDNDICNEVSEFDGHLSFVQLGVEQYTDFDSTQSFALRIGFRTASSQTQYIYHSFSPANGWLYGLDARYSGKLCFQMGGQDSIKITTTQRFDDSLWHFTVLQIDRQKQTVQIYVDDILQTLENRGQGSLTDPYTLNMAGTHTNANPGIIFNPTKIAYLGRFFKGALLEFGLYKGILPEFDKYFYYTTYILKKNILYHPENGEKQVDYEATYLGWFEASTRSRGTVQYSRDSLFNTIDSTVSTYNTIPNKAFTLFSVGFHNVLLPNTTYYWRVRGENVCSSDLRPWSDTWRFTTKNAIHTDKIPTESTLSLHPNPAHSTVRVSIAEKDFTENIPIRLYNLQGQIVYSSTLHKPSTELPIHQLPAGVYIVVVRNKDYQLQEKLIIQK